MCFMAFIIDVVIHDLNHHGSSRHFRAVDSIGFHIPPVTSDRSNHIDAYCYKIFRCNQKHLCGLLPAFGRPFSLYSRVSVAGKTACNCVIMTVTAALMLTLGCAISGTIATHSLCIGYPRRSSRPEHLIVSCWWKSPARTSLSRRKDCGW